MSNIREPKNIIRYISEGELPLLGRHLEIQLIGIALLVPLPVNELCRKIAPEGKTSTAALKTVGRIMYRN